MREKTLHQLVSARLVRDDARIEEPVTLDDLKRVLKDRLEMETMLKAIHPDPMESALKPLTFLKEAGLDLGTVTGGLKTVADIWKETAATEKEARKEAENEAKEARAAAERTQTELLRLQLENFLQQQNQMIQTLVKELRREPDPFTKTLQDVLADAVSSRFRKVFLNDEERKSPEEELLEKLSFVERLKEVLGVRRDSTLRESLLADASANRAKIELAKILLEDEREREHLAEMRRLEEKRLEALKAGASFLKDNIGDLIRAILETTSTLKQRQPAPPPEPSMQHIAHQHGAQDLPRRQEPGYSGEVVL